ncbi:hypothetical protein V6N11_031873 [Hibiscus sabdariffa]|uniref:Uncharacterized protein n=1 Tax=Hibiscus sabdariffa TaxID=183260 RepID=A0ABR2SYX0_9ROSI
MRVSSNGGDWSSDDVDLGRSICCVPLLLLRFMGVYLFLFLASKVLCGVGVFVILWSSLLLALCRRLPDDLVFQPTFPWSLTSMILYPNVMVL